MTFIQGLCDEHLSKKDLSDILTEDLFFDEKIHRHFACRY